MKVVDRATFLALPPGTVYAKYGDQPTQANCIDLGELCIKADHRGNPPTDWYEQSLAAWPEHNDFGELIDVDTQLRDGEDLPPDFDCPTADGLFDQEQLFAVYSEADVTALIVRLQRAKEEAFGTHGTQSERENHPPKSENSEGTPLKSG